LASALPPEIGWRVAFWIGILPAFLIFFIRRGSDDSDIFKQALARSKARGERTSLASIFRPNVIRITILASLLALGAQGAGFAVSNYLTTFLADERGIGTSLAGICVMFNSLGGFFCFLVTSFVFYCVDRRHSISPS